MDRNKRPLINRKQLIQKQAETNIVTMVLTLEDMLEVSRRGNIKAKGAFFIRDSDTHFITLAWLDAIIQRELGRTDNYCYKFNKYIILNPENFFGIPGGTGNWIGWNHHGATEPRLPFCYKMPYVKNVLDYWIETNPNWNN